ncbi:hypothetical protein BH18CHL2_BH18CHL2_06900 [soil metagenome]
MSGGGRPRGLPLQSRDDRAVYVPLAAVLAGLLWCIGAIDVNEPQPERFGLLLVGGLLALAAARGAGIGALACVYAVAIAAAERLAREPLAQGSDVIPATREAIEVVLAGGNPYTHVLQSTIPVGSPFPYPPGELLFYLPAYVVTGGIDRVETWSGILTTAAIAAAGARAGFALAALPAMLYATWGVAAFRTVDGGNDVSAALLVVISLAALALRPRAAFVVSALALGWALAFKAFAVLVLPIVLRHLAVARAPWRAYAAIAIGTAATMSVPFLVRDPAAFVSQQLAALTFHDEVWGTNVLHALATSGVDHAPLLPAFFVLEVALALAALGVALFARLSTIGRSALAAAIVIAVPLLLARWTTQSYYVYAATLALAGLALFDEPAAVRAD